MYEENYSVMVRVHEIALKGKNRPMFFNQLVKNLRKALSGTGVVAINRRHMSVEVILAPENSWPEIADRIRTVFGVVKFYRCHKVAPTMDAIKDFLRSEIPRLNFRDFRVVSKRGDKSFPFTSPQLNHELGAMVQRMCEAEVNLSNPEVSIFVEIQPREALVYFEEMPGPGGLPVGVSGSVLALLSGGIDSPVAALRMLKRGCRVTFVHFHSFPLVDGTSKEKALELVELLNKFQFQAGLVMIPFGDVQRDIILSAPPAYRVVVYRRFMFRIAQYLALALGSHALVTGESVGQVGSQTLENIASVRSVVGMPILSPLIGTDKQEIVDEARSLGSYDISIIPDQDCCTLFVPKHPVTRSTTEEVDRIESALDIDALVEKAISGGDMTYTGLGKGYSRVSLMEVI